MAGSDLPSGGSGNSSPPPRTPPPAKRKRGNNPGPPSLPSRATRSSAAARQTLVGPVRWARRASTGARMGRGRGRGHGRGDVEGLREVILEVRLALSVCVPGDNPDYPYPEEIRRSGSRSDERINCKIGYLSRFPKKRPEIHPVKCQISVPEWKNGPSDKEAADYKAETLTQLGTIVCPLNMDIPVTNEPEEGRKEWVDSCNCSHPESEDCVQVHVGKARSWVKEQLGVEAFRNCGLDAMGEQVGELWTAVDRRKLEGVDRSIPQDKHQNFMKIALKQELGQMGKKDLAKYYFNVFLPRRLASWTRAERREGEAVDTGDEGSSSSEDDGSDDDQPGKKGKCSVASSTRYLKCEVRKDFDEWASS